MKIKIELIIESDDQKALDRAIEKAKAIANDKRIFDFKMTRWHKG